MRLPEPRRIVHEGRPRGGLDVARRMAAGPALCRGGEARWRAATRRLAGQHYLAVDVSDARAVFRIEGPKAAEVLMKLCPVDHATLAPGRIAPHPRRAGGLRLLARRATAITLVSFRSVAAYVMGLLHHSAQPGQRACSGRAAAGRGTDGRFRGNRQQAPLTFPCRRATYSAQTFTQPKGQSHGFHPSRSSLCP